MNTPERIFFFVLIFLNCELIYGQGEVLFVPQYKPYGIPTESGITSYDLFDLNSDNHPDAAASINLNGFTHIVIKYGPNLDQLRTNPDFVFSLSPKSNPFYLAWSDIDGDGDQDLYLGEHAEYQITARVYILENMSSGTALDFDLKSNLPFGPHFIMSVPSPVDFNNDGMDDLFVSDFEGRITIYENGGNFTFTNRGTNIMGLSDIPSACAFARLSDGKNLLSYDKKNKFNLFIYDGSNYKRDTVSNIIGNPDSFNAGLFQPRIRDLNQDGRLDAFLSANTFSMNSGYYSDSWLYTGFCIDTLYKNEIPIANATYAANELIISTGEVKSPLGVIYKAGESIVLDTTFTVQLGGLFEILIESCDN